MAFNGPLVNLVPPGTVLPFAGTTAPAGYLLCDGSAVSRTAYATLFTAIGAAHGAGDASTTFNIPDYRGRFMRGVDGSAGRDTEASSRTAAATGGNTGNALGSVQVSAVQSHVHLMYSPGGGNYGSTGTHSFYWGSGGGPIGYNTNATGNADTRPMNAAINFIIKF